MIVRISDPSTAVRTMVVEADDTLTVTITATQQDVNPRPRSVMRQ